MGIRGVKKPHPLDPAAAGVSQLLARGASGVKRPHPLGSVPSRSGVSQLTAESGVASVTVPGVKISALPAAAGGTVADQFEVNQGGTSKRLTAAQLATALPPVDWSSITGKPTSLPPNGPASGDLAGTYPGPTIKPSVTNGQVLTTVGGVSAWAAPTGGAPSGAAGGALTGTYPNPTLVGGPLSNYALTSSIPTTLPPNGAAGGDLAGSYPSPTIKANVALTGNPTAPTPTAGDNDTSIATTAFVQTAVAGATGGAATLAAGSVGYGAAGNVLTGVLADFAWDATNKRLGLNTTPTSTLHAKSLLDGGSAFKAEATASTGTFAEFFTLSASDANPGSGFVFKINGGFNAGINYMSLDRSGYLSVYGNVHVLYPFSAPAGGGSWCGIPVTNGNTGFFVSNGAPTWTADKGTLSLDNSGSLPWYNPTGTGTWDRLVGETSTQTLSNKTIAGYLTTAAAGTTYLPLAGGTLTGPLTGTNATFSENTSAQSTLSVSNTGVNGGGIKLTGDGATTPSKYIRVNGGNLQVINSSYSAVPLSLSDTGNLTVSGGITAAGTVMAPGAQIQMVSTETGAVATGTTVIPLDDTIPQQTEGDQYMSLAITPKSATSKLIIEVIVNCSHNAVVDYIVALFQDAAANALAASLQYQFNAGQRMNISLRHTMTSGTTSATTFKVRIGGSGAGTLTFNGYNGGRFMGGVMASSIVIREVAP